MTKSGIVTLTAIAMAALGASGWYYLQRVAPAPCGSEAALDDVHAQLRDRYAVDQILFNGVRTLTGSPLSSRIECEAEIAPIRGNIDASAMGWRGVHYSSDRRINGRAVIESVLEHGVPLAAPEPDFWQRLRIALTLF